MISHFRYLSIKWKLLSILSFSSILSLLLALLLLVIVETIELKAKANSDLTAMASLIANRSTAALSFDDPNVAQENLAALKEFGEVEAACLYGMDGKVFTSLHEGRKQVSSCPQASEGMRTHFERLDLFVIEPVLLDGEKIGAVYIAADLLPLLWRKLQFIGLVLGILFIASLITFFLTAPLLNLVSEPLIKLAVTARKISREKNYSLRAVKRSDDELDVLVDAFNNMIETVDQQNKALVSVKNNYLALYDNNPTMVFYLNMDGLVLSVNRFGARQLHMTAEQVQGCLIYDFVHPDDINAIRALFDLCQLNINKVYKQEVRIICDNGTIIWGRVSARLLTNDQGQRNMLLVCEDVTETKRLTEKIEYQARHDALTGLVNRREFDTYVQKLVERTRQLQGEHALCYLDLDQFKVVNDTCGHMAGDELLRQLGDLLRQNIRQNDVLARLGGDEFGILMYDCPLIQAINVSEKLRNVVRDFQFGWDDRSFSVGVSIGVTLINRTSGNAVELLKMADAACYAAKEKGRNRVHVFSPDDEELASRQGEMQWVQKIQQGIENNRFCLYGQLIVPVGKMTEGLHFETLIRYRNEQGVAVPPGAFLPAAERYNMAASLDRWVIENLFAWLAEKPGVLEKVALCSVNLSGLTLSDESMLAYIDRALRHWQIPTQKICFEITETAAISNLGYARHFIDHFRQKGCSFSLDDFGSGLSSFAYLKNLPVDYLKIDGLFVKDILDDKVDLAMVESINSVGHVMGKKTIAEFVENDGILAKLDELGVDYAQGYGIAKPVPLDEL
ncbi:EAL domain-containing protein [Methylomarinum vadi]|uniref:EAL domain-containing protein n=1 Tax=Methylomarinum vadi TaxID=438855 RepID=UPI0004DEEA27|nr:EAL domain-containing protein [Methylomarinum vadi]